MYRLCLLMMRRIALLSHRGRDFLLTSSWNGSWERCHRRSLKWSVWHLSFSLWYFLLGSASEMHWKEFYVYPLLRPNATWLTRCVLQTFPTSLQAQCPCADAVIPLFAFLCRWIALWLDWSPSSSAWALFTPPWPTLLSLLCRPSAWKELPLPLGSSQLKAWCVLQPGLVWLSERLWPIWCLQESHL